MYTYYISVGSNLGKREGYIQTALDTLQTVDGVMSVISSTLLETEPWGNTDQGVFLNGVFRCESTIEPIDMLHLLQGLEQAANRDRKVHWGPRTLELDIILVFDESGALLQVNTPELIVPHPYFWERNFVLEPLAELWPEFSYQGQSIRQRAQELQEA